MNFEIQTMETDVLIIGGGTAGCFSALAISEQSSLKVVITDKANIKRSGCLAAGVNALNAYIGKGQTPESFVEYVKRDSEGVIREDLVYSIAKRLNCRYRACINLRLAVIIEELLWEPLIQGQ